MRKWDKQTGTRKGENLVFSVVGILLRDVGHEAARIGVKSLEELASLREEALGDLAGVLDEDDVVFSDNMPLGS
jgi:hypothetical protein